MNYLEWGTSYLEEAEKIKNYIAKIKSEDCSFKSRDDIMSTKRRINTLYEMYLDCKHTGCVLCERGKEKYDENSACQL